MALKTLVVDDEQLARDELCFLLESIPDVEIVGQAANGIEAVNMARKLTPDLLFLDIQMPGLDGFQVVEKLIGDTHLPQFVFVTAYDRYAIKAFEVNALDYLLKPVEKDRLHSAISRISRDGAVDRTHSQMGRLLNALERGSAKQRLVVKVSDRFMLVDSASIIYATVQDGVVTVATDERTGTSNHRTLDELVASLDPTAFWRVHRSFVVNLHRIREVIPWFNRTIQLKMDDRAETEIPVSRLQTRKLKEHLKI